MIQVKNLGEKNKPSIYILSNSRSLYSTRRFFEEAIKNGNRAKVYPPISLTLHVEKKNNEIYYNREKLSIPDIIIPRVGQKKPNYSLAVIKQFEMMGCVVLNPTQAILRSRDKLRSLQVMAQHNISVPKTFFLDDTTAIDLAIEAVGGPPIIIKITEGTQGMGVMLAESKRSARSILESIINQGQHLLVQEFISESSGKDIRAIVLDNKVIATMQRSSIGDEFRSNTHRGGVTSNFKLNVESERMAIVATRSLGLRFAGVDLIESSRGPLILEVNPSPGLEGIETATNTNIAQMVIRHLNKSFYRKTTSHKLSIAN